MRSGDLGKKLFHFWKLLKLGKNEVGEGEDAREADDDGPEFVAAAGVDIEKSASSFWEGLRFEEEEEVEDGRGVAIEGPLSMLKRTHSTCKILSSLSSSSLSASFESTNLENEEEVSEGGLSFSTRQFPPLLQRTKYCFCFPDRTISASSSSFSCWLSLAGSIVTMDSSSSSASEIIGSKTEDWPVAARFVENEEEEAAEEVESFMVTFSGSKVDDEEEQEEEAIKVGSKK